MGVLLNHSSGVNAVPRAVAAAFHFHVHFSLFSHPSFCHHRRLHYPLLHTHNFTRNGYHIPPTSIRNFSRPHYLEQDTSGITSTDTVKSTDLVAFEYAHLNLPYNSQEVGHVRIRQHVNPLSSSFAVPAEPPDWNVVFKDPLLPLMVDIGSGSGRFLLWLAKSNSDTKNYLGVEIRKKLVKRANFWVKELDLFNAHFMFANATISFERLVSSYPGPLVFVSILCPDPHFKKRHHKRRVLQKPLVDSIVNNLTAGGQVFVQSDVLEVATDMRNQFDSTPDMLHIDAVNSDFDCDPDGWLLKNPMGIRTEREIHAEHEGSKIYRRMYQKRA